MSEETPDDIIRYRGKIFKIPNGKVRKIAKRHDNLESIAKGIHATGYQGHLVGLVPECEVCPYNQPANGLKGKNQCNYDEIEVEWATRFSNGKGDFMANRPSCMVLDTLVKVLVVKGEFDDYEVYDAPKYEACTPEKILTTYELLKKKLRESTPRFLRNIILV